LWPLSAPKDEISPLMAMFASQIAMLLEEDRPSAQIQEGETPTL
jgi:hypothetical protein